MAKSSMKKNSNARKVSQRALDHQKELEEQEAQKAAAAAKKNQQVTAMKDAMYSSGGGLLTIVSLLFGLYGIISLPAIWLCWKGIQKTKDYGWRGVILPGICIVLNVAWIVLQIVMLFSPTIRVAFYEWTATLFQ